MATTTPRLRADRPQSAVTQRQQQEAAAHVAANPKFNWEAYGDAAVRDIQASGVRCPSLLEGPPSLDPHGAHRYGLSAARLSVSWWKGWCRLGDSNT